MILCHEFFAPMILNAGFTIKNCMARVFSAVEIEDEKVLQRLEDIRDVLNLGFSKVPGKKMHITLQFFEDIDEDEIEKVKETLENIQKQPFRIEIRGVGAFPSEDYIRVVWAGIRSHEIFELQKQAKVHEVPSDDRHEFKPHITLLRVKDISPEKKKKLKRMIEEHKDEKFAEVDVESVKLFESKITGNGSKYEELAEVNL
jgi:2'-5' RNA ligase